MERPQPPEHRRKPEDYPQPRDDIDPDPYIAHLRRTDQSMSEKGAPYLRVVGEIEDDEQNVYRLALRNLVLHPHDELGKYWAEMPTHRKVAAISVGSLLIGLGAGSVRFQRNRTQRKKMGPRNK